jgi:uncharacterized damage-inducible protein DinB
MNSELTDCLRAFESLEADRARVLAQLAEWPTASISFRPAPNAWSAPEVLDHVVRSETGITASMRRNLQTPHILGGEDRLKVATLYEALRSERKFEVPAGAEAAHPDPRTTLPEVASRWERSRMALGSFMERLTAADLSYGLFCHPFAGWMTFGEVLEHFSTHLYHHEFQLARLRAARDQAGV